MIQFFADWYRRYFSDPQAVLLAVLLVLTFTIIILMGGMLAPLLASIVIAYLLEGPIQQLEKYRLPRNLAVTTVFLLFLTGLGFFLFALVPLLWRQMNEFMLKLPAMINAGQQLLLRLPKLYPQFITTQQVGEIIAVIRSGITDLAQNVLSFSIASIPALITLLVYFILGPVLVFFFLKDKRLLCNWVTNFLPRERALLKRVWAEMDDQIGNYVRGKFYEILIVGGVTYVVFALLGLAFAPLLGVLVGLSVIIPYIGATVVTLPVAVAGYFQFGWSSDFVWIMTAYAIIQALDGNLLVPILFSETVNLHPVSIITAVLVFGGLWGFWGVFFAIPLATLVKSVSNAWPRTAEVDLSSVTERPPPSEAKSMNTARPGS